MNFTTKANLKFKNIKQIIYVQPVENTYGKTLQYLKKIFDEKNVITKFHKQTKKLKAHKTRENHDNYWSIIADIEVKLVCKENTLKGT